MAGNMIKRFTGIVSLLTVVLFVLSSARCDNDEPFASQELTFVLPVTIKPSDDTILVGDTLWLKVDVSDSLYEFNTKRKIRLPRYSFGQTSIIVRKLIGSSIGLSDQESAGSKFNIIDTSNAITFLGDTFIDVLFSYNDLTDNYKLFLGFVPKENGVFCLQFLGPYTLQYEGFVDLGKNDEGAKIIPVYSGLYFPINENGNNNYQLFKDNCLALYKGESDSVGYYREYKGTFTFRVVE
jgi:hypothetical protein